MDFSIINSSFHAENLRFISLHFFIKAAGVFFYRPPPLPSYNFFFFLLFFFFLPLLFSLPQPKLFLLFPRLLFSGLPRYFLFEEPLRSFPPSICFFKKRRGFFLPPPRHYSLHITILIVTFLFLFCCCSFFCPSVNECCCNFCPVCICRICCVTCQCRTHSVLPLF